MPNTHLTVSMATRHGSAEIDAEIIDLITIMNTIPGLETMNSCQGGSGQWQFAYVQFMNDGSKESTHSCVRFQQLMIEAMNGEWRKHGRMMSKHYRKHGSHPNDANFYFYVAMGDGYMMNWTPYTYPAVLSAVREVAKKMSTSVRLSPQK